MTEKFLMDLGAKLIEHFGPQITVFIWALVLSFAAPLAGKLLDLLVAFLSWAKAKTNETWIFGKLDVDDFIYDHISAAVLAVKDSFVDSIKAKSVDGKLTKDEALEATNLAFKNFCDRITQTDYDRLMKIIAKDSEPVFEEIIKARIQTVVADVKMPQVNPLPAPASVAK